MIKKMCPVCDLPVNTGNYCPRCKRIIRNPYTQNVDYYLNVRHSEFEAECDFHYPYLEADYQGESGSSATSVQNRPVQNCSGHLPKQGGEYSLENEAYRNPAGAGGVRPAETKNHTGKTVLIMAAVGLVTVAMVTFVNIEGVLRDYLKGSGEATEAYNYDYESDFTKLSNEAVIEAGEQCMGFYHFPADGVYVSEQLLEAVESSDFGCRLDSDEFYTDNYLYEDTTYYESVRSFYLTDSTSEMSDDEYVYQYVDVNYDTATNELHDYISRLNSNEASLAFLERFLTATEESSGIAAEDRKTDQIMEEARNLVNQGQSSYIYEGLFVIEIYRYEVEDALYVYVSYLDPEVGSEL